MRADDAATLAATEPSAREDPDLAGELLTRFRFHRPVRGVSVTDLVDPRGAFWRSVAPVPIPADRAQRLQEGYRLHEQLGRRLGPAAAREFRVRRDGIVGRIDLLDGRPVELKTTESPPNDDDDLRERRPGYVEQLAMYAALLDVPEGRLVVIGPPRDGPPEVQVWDLEVRDLAAVRSEMLARADRLRRARHDRVPGELPRCVWFDRGCPYRKAAACDCTGAETPVSGAILAEVGPLRPAPKEAARIAGIVATLAPEATEVGRFRDLAYPRRAYFDARSTTTEEPAPVGSGEADETWSALQAVVEDGPPGESELRYDPTGEPSEGVPVFRSEPCLVKSSRAVRPTPAERLVADRPHYVLELALRCASVGARAGWLLLGLERVPSDGMWIRTQRVEFGSPTELQSLLATRRAMLADARRRADPSGLPTCPSWMFERCPHRAVCGCGAAPGAGTE